MTSSEKLVRFYLNEKTIFYLWYREWEDKVRLENLNDIVIDKKQCFIVFYAKIKKNKNS